MEIVETTEPATSQKESMRELWNEEYPAQLQYATLADFEAYLNGVANKRHYLMMNDDGSIDGWCFSFLRDGEAWFGIIVSGRLQGSGYGTLLLNHAKENAVALNGWVTDHDRYVKADGGPYSSPLGFYIKNGFSVCTDTRLELEKLSAVKITWCK
jgi:GNAT superfamily N-acetyltransferase